MLSLRNLVALVELGSFGRAAAALQLSQPALTRSIQALERMFGTKLVLRTPNGVFPTDFGRLLLERARGLLHLADEIDQDVLRVSALQCPVTSVSGPDRTPPKPSS